MHNAHIGFEHVHKYTSQKDGVEWENSIYPRWKGKKSPAVTIKAIASVIYVLVIFILKSY